MNKPRDRKLANSSVRNGYITPILLVYITIYYKGAHGGRNAHCDLRGGREVGGRKKGEREKRGEEKRRKEGRKKKGRGEIVVEKGGFCCSRREVFAPGGREVRRFAHRVQNRWAPLIYIL